MVQQAAAVERVRLPVRDLSSGAQRGGVAREGLCGAQIADLDGEADGVGKEVLGLRKFFCIAVKRICQRGKCLR